MRTDNHADQPLTTHSLRRTSPKGQPFIGVCVNCGMENLPASAALEFCPDTQQMTQGEALIVAIKGDDTASVARGEGQSNDGG